MHCTYCFPYLKKPHHFYFPYLKKRKRKRKKIPSSFPVNGTIQCSSQNDVVLRISVFTKNGVVLFLWHYTKYCPSQIRFLPHSNASSFSKKKTLPHLSASPGVFYTPFGRGERNGMEWKKKNILRIFSHFPCLEV